MVFDPLDGSSNLDVSVSVGTIFSSRGAGAPSLVADADDGGERRSALLAKLATAFDDQRLLLTYGLPCPLDLHGKARAELLGGQVKLFRLSHRAFKALIWAPASGPDGFGIT